MLSLSSKNVNKIPKQLNNTKIYAIIFEAFFQERKLYMEFKIILKFKYNKKDYCIIQVNNKELVYVIKENKKIITELKQEELEVFRIVHNSLKINFDNSVNLGFKNVDNKKFNIFYDTQNKLYYWYKICDNKAVKANDEENKILNNRFNKIPVRFYLKNKYEKNGKEEYIQRFVRIGKKMIPLFILASISLTSFTNSLGLTKRFNDSSSIYKNLFNEDKNYDYSKIEKAILDNPYLKSEEKELLQKLKFVFDENYQYMDISEIIDRLKNLKIEYYEKEDAYINGCFDSNKYTIEIYGANNLEEARLQTVVHEILHVFQASTTSQGRFVMELSNQLLTQEVLRRMAEMNLLDDNNEFENEYEKYTQFDKSGYTNFMYIEYYLAEILTQEQLKAYQFCPDENIIVEALLQINGISKEQLEKAIKEKKENKKEISKKSLEVLEKRDNAYVLLDTIDSIFAYDEKSSRFIVDCHYEDYLKKYCEIFNQLNYYYTKKYGKSLEENFVIGLQDKDIYNDIKIEDLSLSTIFYFIDVGILETKEFSKDQIPEIYKQERETAVNNTLLEYAYINSEQEKDNLHIYEKEDAVKDIYYVPRTFFSDEHKYAKVYFPSEKCANSVIEINDEVQKKFEKYYKEEKIKKEELEMEEVNER